jgi:signal transduction histidine kinase/CheY-like chemotaxis protein
VNSNGSPRTIDDYAAALALAERRLERSERARASAEAMLELRSRALLVASQELNKRENDLLERLDADARILLNAQEVANVATFHAESDGTLIGSRNLGRTLGLKSMVTDLEQIGAMVHPIEAADARHFLTGKFTGIGRRDIRILDQYGVTRWLRWHIRPGSNAAGHFHGAVQDITEQRVLERRQRVSDALRRRQLRKLERLSAELQDVTAAQQRDADFLRAVLETVPQGVTVFDADLRLLIWNRRFTDLYNLADHSLESGMGREAFGAIPWATARTYQRLAGDEQVEIHPSGMLFAPGDYIENLEDGRSIEVRVVKRENGGIIKSYTDITDYVATQDELRRRGELLAERIEELEAVGARLEESRNLAVKADRAKSRFLAMMSHDIRTPMNAILAMLELLSTTDLTKEQRDMLSLARSSGDQMLFLLADIIEVARADGWSVDLEDQVVGLPAFLGAIVGSWRPLARRKGLEIELTLADNLPAYISIDPKRLRQLLDNLISNAIKFTRKGTVAVTADLAAGKDGPRLHLAVIDTGRGIDPKRQQTLFRDMRRVHNPMDPNVEGTGLGLSICSRIVDAMHGRIGVESYVDVGSTFWVMLPFVQAAAPVGDIKAALTETKRVIVDGHAPHLLIAEDVVTNQIVIAAMLDRLGCTYEITNDGLEALNAIKRGGHFDAVLMDVSMPTMDGMEATTAIRALGDGIGSLPIIGVTAFAAEEERVAMRATGMNDILTKPLQLEGLRNMLDRLADLRAPVKVRSRVLPVPVPQFDTSSVVDVAQLRSHFDPLPEAGRQRLENAVINDLTHWTHAYIDALAKGDDQSAGRARHTLKGICAGFGASTLWQAVVELADAPADKGSGGAARVRMLLDATVSEIRVVAGRPDRRTA